MFGSSPWGLVAMYVVSQWPAPFIKSSCLDEVWANTLQYDSYYTPWRTSCAPLLSHLLSIPRFPNFVSCVLSSVLSSHIPSFPPRTAFVFYVIRLSTKAFHWESLHHTRILCAPWLGSFSCPDVVLRLSQSLDAPVIKQPWILYPIYIYVCINLYLQTCFRIFTAVGLLCQICITVSLDSPHKCRKYLILEWLLCFSQCCI